MGVKTLCTIKHIFNNQSHCKNKNNQTHLKNQSHCKNKNNQTHMYNLKIRDREIFNVKNKINVRMHTLHSYSSKIILQTQ